MESVCTSTKTENSSHRRPCAAMAASDSDTTVWFGTDCQSESGVGWPDRRVGLIRPSAQRKRNRGAISHRSRRDRQIKMTTTVPLSHANGAPSMPRSSQHQHFWQQTIKLRSKFQLGSMVKGADRRICNQQHERGEFSPQHRLLSRALWCGTKASFVTKPCLI